MPGPLKRLLEQPDEYKYEELSDQQKEAVDCYRQGLSLWNENINHDLASEQAMKNLEAMRLWYRAADMGFIKAIAVIIGSIDEGGFVKDAETNREVPFYGRSMGLNIGGKSGWEIVREFGQKAIDMGLDDPASFGNSRMAREIIYTSLAESYGDDECLGVEPWAADYRKCYDYYMKVADINFKTYRYVAELFWFGHLEPPEGYTAAEISLEYMLKAVQSKDATANYYLGLWYLNDGGNGPVLPVPEGETKYTMAVKYLEAGRSITDHGTIRKTYESLLRLAQIYESGEGAPSVPKNLNKANEIYDECLSEKYFPGKADFTAGKERILAELEAEKKGGFVLTFDGAVIRDGKLPGLDICIDEANGIIKVTTADGHHPGEGKIVSEKSEKTEFAGYEWLILEEKEDRRLIIASDVLFEKAYNEKLTQVTWETCDIRKYLNGEFLESFSEKERGQIIKTRIANPYNDYFKTISGNVTEDFIFLLSQEEEEQYFAEKSKAKCTWWTRTPGIDQRFEVMITPTGERNNYGWRVFNQLGGVRPAMWIRK